ncbi:MAG: hypothetical protein JWN78_2786 [Bacteroidota bacterium]|nr:hypothetical protein [Bacteroidota bacterium]
MRKRNIVYDGIFILLLTAICHLLFSRLGFNPTDEGFVLSASNRMLHGMIPHVDFSSVRPLGYAYLHIPELLISPKYFFLVSRFVFWLENVLIAFFWMRFVMKQTQVQISQRNFYLLVIATFIFNVHYFPCSVLHTIDGLLFCLIGLNIISSERKYAFAGFLFIGFAALCKQNYFIVLPVTLLLFNRKSFIGNSIFGILPVVVYVLFVSLNGGWNDLTTQLRGHNELWDVGFKKYLFNYFFIAGLILGIAVRKLKINNVIYLIAITIILSGLLVSDHYHGNIGFIIPGILLVELFFTAKEINLKKVIGIALLLAWCVSVSVGYNTPALFLGGCFSMLILILFSDNLQKSNAVSFMSTMFLLVIFYFVRTIHIYRDLPCLRLSHKLDGIVEGASGIRTNTNTFLVLKELDSLKHAVPNLVVVPDFTACNILHSHQSKILTEWANKTEIPNDKILDKVVSKIRSDSTLIFAIPKYQTALLKDGFTEFSKHGMNYPIIRFVKENYPLTTSTKYFELRFK